MKCATCGEEHELLEPTFRRPDAVVSLSRTERAKRVKEDDDLCAIWGRSDSEPHRYFVRGVLVVPLLDAEAETAWGLWVEVVETDFNCIVDKWTDPQQTDTPAMKAVIANRVPGYAETIGLHARLKLTGATTRPDIAFDGSSIHPFVVECRNGVCTHRVMEWLEEMK